MSDLYADLLNQLEHGDPEKVLRTEPAVTQKGARVFEITGESLNGPYSNEDLQVLLGFAMSINTSMAVYCSTPLASSLCERETLQARWDSYVEKCPTPVTSKGEELCLHLIEASAAATTTIMAQTKDIELCDSAPVNAAISMLLLAYLFGVNSQVLLDTSKPDYKTQLAGALTTMMAGMYKHKSLFAESEVQTQLAGMVETLLSDELLALVADGRGKNLKEFAEVMSTHVKAQREEGGTAG
jgi:hypothetical protein